MSMAAQWEQCAVKVDLVAPVPLHANRLRQRGYNQAALLANELEQHTGLPLRKDLMVRVRPTPPQMRLDARARRRNVHGAFICPDELVEGRRVLVVDDVCTTGATLEACANALREKGATAIWALTAARAP
jgi:ComF family protein